MSTVKLNGMPLKIDLDHVCKEDETRCFVCQDSTLNHVLLQNKLGRLQWSDFDFCHLLARPANKWVFCRQLMQSDLLGDVVRLLVPGRSATVAIFYDGTRIWTEGSPQFLARFIDDFVRWRILVEVGLGSVSTANRAALKNCYEVFPLSSFCDEVANCMATQVSLLVDSSSFLTTAYTHIFPTRSFDIDLSTGFPLCSHSSRECGFFQRAAVDVDFEQPGGVILEWLRALCLDDEELLSTLQLALGRMMLGEEKNTAPIIGINAGPDLVVRDLISLVMDLFGTQLAVVGATTPLPCVTTGTRTRGCLLVPSIGRLLVSSLLRGGYAITREETIRGCFLLSDNPVLTYFPARKRDAYSGDVAHPRLVLLDLQCIFARGDYSYEYGFQLGPELIATGVVREAPKVTLETARSDPLEMTWLLTWLVIGARRNCQDPGALSRAANTQLRAIRERCKPDMAEYI